MLDTHDVHVMPVTNMKHLSVVLAPGSSGGSCSLFLFTSPCDSTGEALLAKEEEAGTVSSVPSLVALLVVAAS